MLKVLDEVCKPTKGSKYSAAIDLYAREDIVIGAGETVKVPLGVCIDLENNAELLPMVKWGIKKLKTDECKDHFIRAEIDKFSLNHYLQLEPRSSLRAKGLIAGTGIIDLDYKDEIMIILHNPIWQTRLCNITTESTAKTISHFGATTNLSYKISKGDKIAQILLKEHKTYLMGVDTEEERVGGLGSTGK